MLASMQAPMGFDGFDDRAFAFFEQVQAQPSWAFVQSRREDWQVYVHTPMEALLDLLGAEFGRNGYAYNLHKDSWLWSHQVGLISVTDTIGYRVVLSLEGLLAQAGWIRSAPDQVQRYRRAVASDHTGKQLADWITAARRSGFAIEGKQLATRPRDWPADHPRIDLLRYQTLGASRWIRADALSGPQCAEAVSSAWRELRPLTNWLSENVGPRQRRR